MCGVQSRYRCFAGASAGNPLHVFVPPWFSSWNPNALPSQGCLIHPACINYPSSRAASLSPPRPGLSLLPRPSRDRPFLPTGPRIITCLLLAAAPPASGWVFNHRQILHCGEASRLVWGNITTRDALFPLLGSRFVGPFQARHSIPRYLFISLGTSQGAHPPVKPKPDTGSLLFPPQSGHRLVTFPSQSHGTASKSTRLLSLPDNKKSDRRFGPVAEWSPWY